MRVTVLLVLALAMAVSPAVATAACRCGEPAEVTEEGTTRTCPCCEPGECHCCCSGAADDARPTAPRDGVTNCGCTKTAPRLAPTPQEGAGLDGPLATTGSSDAAAVPALVRAGEEAPCARAARPPGAGFTVPLRI